MAPTCQHLSQQQVTSLRLNVRWCVFLSRGNVLTQFASSQCVPPAVPVPVPHTTQRRNVQQQRRQPGSNGQQRRDHEPDVRTDELHEHGAGESLNPGRYFLFQFGDINVHLYGLINVIVAGE